MSHARTRGTHPIDSDVARGVIAEIERELESRIRPILAGWPEQDVRALLHRMATIKYKYEGAASLRRTPPRAR